jgi:hypothetical protein
MRTMGLSLLQISAVKRDIFIQLTPNGRKRNQEMNRLRHSNEIRQGLKRLAICGLAAWFFGGCGADAASVFYKTGTDTVEDFSSVSAAYTFDVVNSGMSYMMLAFESNPHTAVSSNVVRLAPGERAPVTMSTPGGPQSFTLAYDIAHASTPFKSNTDSYRAMNDGETEMIVPVVPSLYNSMKNRASNIFNQSKVLVTDPNMPSGTYIYTPGPAYSAAGLFARDFLYQLEGGGRDLVSASEVRSAVDYLAGKQLTTNITVGSLTYPKGAIPDHVYPNGQYGWGPGYCYGNTPGSYNRPSMDEALCFVSLAWQYGSKANWDASWKTWFQANSQKFADAWNSVPRNSASGLVTQWTTANHVGANGITETTGPSVMWGFHDSYGFPGDDVGTSVLACNAARALSDMFKHASDTNSAATWGAKAANMQNAIRAQFNAAGYLPWGVNTGTGNAPSMSSPDITGYAVWSGILTPEQAQAASDWLAANYNADKAAGGAANLFNMAPGCHGAVRMARKSDDVNPGSHVWPHTTSPHWENLAYGYNAYQDGGYWYYMSLGIADTLWINHPTEAKEWIANIYSDAAAADANFPYERIDGITPVNNQYNASIGPLLGMGMPADVMSSVSVTVVPEPSTFLLLGAGLAALLFWRRRKAVMDKSH